MFGQQDITAHFASPAPLSPLCPTSTTSPSHTPFICLPLSFCSSHLLRLHTRTGKVWARHFGMSGQVVWAHVHFLFPPCSMPRILLLSPSFCLHFLVSHAWFLFLYTPVCATYHPHPSTPTLLPLSSIFYLSLLDWFFSPIYLWLGRRVTV